MSNIWLTAKSFQKRRIATKLRNVHILIFVLALGLAAVMTTAIITGITSNASEDIARFYSIEAMGKFNLHIDRDLALVQKVSNSTAIINWFTDEEDPQKRSSAYDEMMNYTSILRGTQLHLGIYKSLDEYSINSETTFARFVPFDRLDITNPEDKWYFDCIQSPNEYTINVDIDKATQIWRVWINHKVIGGNNLAGVFCAGIVFDEMVRSLFTHYDNKNIKGYIIDKEGDIQMDSFQSTPRLENKPRIFTINSDPLFYSTTETYLNNIRGYFDLSTEPIVIKLARGSFRYASIVPIIDTDWSVVTFFNDHSLYNITNFLPLAIVLLFAFLTGILTGSIFIRRLVLLPLGRLTKSLSSPNFYAGEIYGSDREDEIGELAQTVQKMRDRLSTYNAELLRAARERERLIRIDQLTDIPNRRSFDERLPLEWGRSIRTKTPLSLIILDLDHFKNYNDTYGHLQGDKALQAVAKVFMQELKRSGDLVARWGGEEFAILLVNTGIAGALDVAERVRQKVENLQIPLADDSISKMTISAGVNCLIPTLNDVLEDFIRYADMALYTAKREGRNKVCQYNSSIHL